MPFPLYIDNLAICSRVLIRWHLLDVLIGDTIWAGEIKGADEEGHGYVLDVGHVDWIRGLVT